MTERLSIIFGHIPNCEKFADIGCDHGYVTKAMLDLGKCEFAVASDISDKCLDKARALIKNEIEEKKAVCIRSNGFLNLPKVDVALISGMGGEEIIGIILGAKELPKTLVLQPMKNADKLRAVLIKLGYGLSVDYTFKSDGKFYDLIKAEKCAKPKKLSKKEIKYGKDNLAFLPIAFIEKLNARINVLRASLDTQKVQRKASRKMKKELKELYRYVKS